MKEGDQPNLHEKDNKDDNLEACEKLSEKGNNSHHLRLENLCYLSLSFSCGMNSLRTSQLGLGRCMCFLSSWHPNLRD